MKFVRTPEYEQKLFEQALFDDKKVIKDAKIEITNEGSDWAPKLKAYCKEAGCFLQFPRALRVNGAIFIADVVEVQNDAVTTKYYRVMKGSIRRKGSQEVVE